MTSLGRILFCAALLGPAMTAGAQAVPCAPSSDGYAQSVFSGVKEFASGLSADDLGWRANVQLPLTTDSLVSFVTSDSVCTAAANAVAQTYGPGVSPQPVWVIAVGPSRYVVFDKKRGSAKRLLAGVFDSTFTWLADFLT